jgi:hypothetical protein
MSKSLKELPMNKKDNQNLLFKEEQRRQHQMQRFQENKVERLKLYESIADNLSL